MVAGFLGNRCSIHLSYGAAGLIVIRILTSVQKPRATLPWCIMESVALPD